MGIWMHTFGKGWAGGVMCVCVFFLHVIEIGYPRSYDGDGF